MILLHHILRLTFGSAFLWFPILVLSAPPTGIQLVQVPIVTGSQLKFYHLSWGSSRFQVGKIPQDDRGFILLGAADDLRRYDGYRFMRVQGDGLPSDLFSVFEFSALSYSDPARNRYRYRLEGLEAKWNKVDSTRRSATYTTLPPRSYTFRVQAPADRGDWSADSVALPIRIFPPWYATSLFQLICVLLLSAFLWALYRYRLDQIAQEINMTLEPRVGERTRIARELYDTLLQSFHGLLLRFQSVDNLLPERPAEAKKRLASAIDQAAQAIAEGRDAVQGLRSSTVESNDLARAVSRLNVELAADETNPNPAVFHAVVEGRTRNLQPIVGDEVYRIAGEALRNAFRHAEARRIEVEIRYDNRQFRLRVRDDGKGIDPKALSQDGGAGHYGLHGMHERAKLVGGKLDVWSDLDSGTEIELTIPSSIAYATSPRSRLSRLFLKLSEKLSRKGTSMKP